MTVMVRIDPRAHADGRREPLVPWCPVCELRLFAVPGIVSNIRGCNDGHRWGVFDEGEPDGHGS